MKINDEVEGLTKQVIMNDDIIVELATCAVILFERKNWGRVIVFISFVGQVVVHYGSKPESGTKCVNLILEWLTSYFEMQLDAWMQVKNAWSALKGMVSPVSTSNDWVISVVVGVILGAAFLISSKMVKEN